MAIPQAPQAAPPQAPQGGSATKIVTDINSGLEQLAQMIGGSDAVDDDDKAKLAAVIQGYQAFVQGLGAPAGAKHSPAPGGAAPMEAGTADVRPVM